MPKKKVYGVDLKQFQKKYNVETHSKCWTWNQSLFRIKTDGMTLNPRRYAVYVAGGTIPPGRHVIAGCGNDYCINPDHTRLRHNGAPLDKDLPMYLEMEDFKLTRSFLRLKYARKMEEIRNAWKDTLRLIIQIRYEPESKSYKEIADKYGIGVSFVKQALSLTVKQFDNMKTDEFDNGETPLDELDAPHDARYFTMEGVS